MAVDEGLDRLAGAFELPEGSLDRLEALGNLVGSAPFALTSASDRETGVMAHIEDSLSALAVPLVREAGSIADVGSGGGFPGLVLAIALPGAHVTLVESVGKKAAFLERTALQLGLANVAVVAVRVEEWAGGRDTQAVVTARAVAPLGVLIEYAAPLLRVGGALIAWKGPAVVAELPDAAAAALLLGMSEPAAATELPQNAENRRALYVSLKLRATPPDYPRAPGKARKRPITA